MKMHVGHTHPPPPLPHPKYIENPDLEGGLNDCVTICHFSPPPQVFWTLQKQDNPDMSSSIFWGWQEKSRYFKIAVTAIWMRFSKRGIVLAKWMRSITKWPRGRNSPGFNSSASADTVESEGRQIKQWIKKIQAINGCKKIQQKIKPQKRFCTEKNDDDTVLHVGNFIFKCWELSRIFCM